MIDVEREIRQMKMLEMLLERLTPTGKLENGDLTYDAQEVANLLGWSLEFCMEAAERGRKLSRTVH